MMSVLLLQVESLKQNLYKIINEEFECPICQEQFVETSVNPDCGHRFCDRCIKESIRKCNKECPTCRTPISTARKCRSDPQFDRLVSFNNNWGVQVSLPMIHDAPFWTLQTQMLFIMSCMSHWILYIIMIHFDSFIVWRKSWRSLSKSWSWLQRRKNI